MVSEMQK